jgi:Tol biopolymer transport system component/predicted Ser/Thr protein kinase
MPLSVGDKLGPYEILAPLGAGGMGEVYRAKDTRLKREVAVKVLPETFARDDGRVARFQREAEVLAALNHPNIAQIYGAEEGALVMELVEGTTLDDLTQQGAIRVKETFEIARQIAEALEAAHEKGIVHRDLKPANIKIKPDGTVKVLDFGLAAILQPAVTGATDPANSPTLTIGATHVGAIMGTAGYMSPEQAVGKPADRRADIWSFGVVLFEMLTGQRLFTGETVSHILADVIKGDIDFGRLPSATPVGIRHLLKRCLDPDVKMRLQAIGEARVAMANAGKGAEPAGAARPRGHPRSRFGIVGWTAVAVLAVGAAVAGLGWWHSSRPVEKPLVRLDVDLGAEISLPSPENTPLSAVALSPDGTRLGYVASAPGGPPRLFTRRLDQSKSVELPGTNGAIGPAFSPDGQWIGFSGGGKYNKISVQGGVVVPLADMPFAGASWSEDGSIITTDSTGLIRIPSGGGTPTKVTELANGEFAAAFPQVLPEGKAVLFVSYVTLSADKASVEVVTLADGRRKTLVPGGTSARYLPTANGSGHLVYTKKATLFAVPFDPHRLEARGTAVPVLDDVAYQALSGGAQFDVSRTGTLVYRKGGGSTAQAMATIQWLTPTTGGAGRKEPLRSKPGIYFSPRLSPDGTRLAMMVMEQGATDLWVYDLRRDAMTRLASVGGPAGLVWSPDSRYLFFGTVRSGILWTRADGAGDPQPLTGTKTNQAPLSITSDGKRLAYSEYAGHAQIWTVPLEETNGQIKAGKPEQFLKSPFAEVSAAFSPEGKWLAYCSNTTGTYEVFVQAFPDTGGRWQISNSGGTFPAWSPNGQDLLYQSGDQIMAVAYTAKGARFVAEKPRIWLAKLSGFQAGFGTAWDLAHDGKRVAVVTPAQTPEAPKQDHEVVMLLNFFDELRRRVPTAK